VTIVGEHTTLFQLDAPHVIPKPHRTYGARLREALEPTVWDRGCTSWYRTASGKNTTDWPDFAFAHRARTRRFDPSAYVLTRTAGDR
jgi:hypothetical protein